MADGFAWGSISTKFTLVQQIGFASFTAKMLSLN
jgi:hypothetical protein